MLLSKRVWPVVAVIIGLYPCLAWGAEEKAKDAAAQSPAAGASNAASEEEIAKLVQQLDADRFPERQAASQKLITAGKAAIPALAKAAVGESLEVTVRSIDILRKFFESSDEPTKQAAKAALETLAKSDRPSAARRAEEVINPKPAAGADQVLPGGGIIIGGQGAIIQGRVQIIAAGANARRISVKNANGVKEIEAEENGRKIKIVDDPQQGIKMEITAKKDGKDTTEKFEAKNAEELKKKHPEAYKVYEEYGKNQGAAAVQIQFGGGALPAVPVPAQAIPRNAAGNQIDLAARLMKSMGQQIERLTKDEQLQKASPESKEAFKKQLAELKQQLADLDKRLQQDAEKPKPAAATDKPADKPAEKPAEEPAAGPQPKPAS